MQVSSKKANILQKGVTLQKKYPSYPFDVFGSEARKRYTVTRDDINDPSQYQEDLKTGREILKYAKKAVSRLESGTLADTIPEKRKQEWKTAVNTSLEEFVSEPVKTAAKEMKQIQKREEEKQREQARQDLKQLRQQLKNNSRQQQYRKQRSGRRHSRWNKTMLYQYNWKQFEQLVGELYEANGYQVTITQGSNDYGVDVWARKGSEVIAIQVKQYRPGNTVGRPELQRVTSMIATGDATKVAVVTSSSFSSTALKYSQSLGAQMKLIDGDGLVRLLSNAGVPSP